MCRWIDQKRSRIIILCTHEQDYLPRIDTLWEFEDHHLMCRGKVPDSLGRWNLAPRGIRTLLARGIVPANISEEDIREAACRIHD